MVYLKRDFGVCAIVTRGGETALPLVLYPKESYSGQTTPNYDIPRNF